MSFGLSLETVILLFFIDNFGGKGGSAPLNCPLQTAPSKPSPRGEDLRKNTH